MHLPNAGIFLGSTLFSYYTAKVLQRNKPEYKPTVLSKFLLADFGLVLKGELRELHFRKHGSVFPFYFLSLSKCSGLLGVHQQLLHNEIILLYLSYRVLGAVPPHCLKDLG